MPDKFSVILHGKGRRLDLRRGPMELSLRGKAVQLILAMATTDFPRYLSRDKVHRLNSWKRMATSSVGKQAARIVDGINSRLGPVVEWELKTQAWRFCEECSVQIDQAIKAEAMSLFARES